MNISREQFQPRGSLSREAMETLQDDIRETAIFEDAHSIDREKLTEDSLIAGVDQAFYQDQAVSAVVVLKDGSVVARSSAVTDLSIPYIPGLLAFREGQPIVAALQALTVDPDLLFLDGSGRIHFREAGIATHIGVLFDVPAIGVAKTLLCGTPQADVNSLVSGDRVPIAADDSMTTRNGEIVGYAFQSRQYPNSMTINPLYVSPGHRVSNETAVDCVERCGGEYKLPEPTRLADKYAEELKSNM